MVKWRESTSGRRRNKCTWIFQFHFRDRGSSDGIELVRLRVISANRQLFQLILSNVIGRKDSNRLLFVSWKYLYREDESSANIFNVLRSTWKSYLANDFYFIRICDVKYINDMSVEKDFFKIRFLKFWTPFLLFFNNSIIRDTLEPIASAWKRVAENRLFNPRPRLPLPPLSLFHALFGFRIPD